MYYKQRYNVPEVKPLDSFLESLCQRAVFLRLTVLLKTDNFSEIMKGALCLTIIFSVVIEVSSTIGRCIYF